MLRRDACFFGGGDPAERYGIEKDMSDRKWENQNGENAPERERVYAPTHAGSGTLNLRPFQKHGAPETDAGEATEPAEQPSGADAAPAGETSAPKADKPAAEIPDLFSDETETDGAEPEQIKTNSGRHMPTVREEKQRARRLTEREKRRREREKRMLRLLTRAIFGVILIAALLLTYFVLIIDKIEVYGCERFTAEEILAASGLKTGQHMWLARLGAAKEAVEADPYIASLEITRVYPDKLVLRVTERVEKAVILGMNTHAVIDGEGYVLSIGTRASYEGLLKVYGTGAGGYHVNQRLGEESDFHSRTLVTLLAALEAAELMDVVETLDISNPLSVTMTTFDGLTVHLGQPDNAEEKLNNFRIVLPALIENGYNKSGTLDLAAKGSPVYSPPNGPAAPIEPGNSPEPGQTPDPNGAQGPEETPVPSASPTPANVPDDPYSG